MTRNWVAATRSIVRYKAAIVRYKITMWDIKLQFWETKLFITAIRYKITITQNKDASDHSQGACVTNPVCDLPSTHHQRSLFHHIESHTTHCYILPWTTFPIIHCPKYTQLFQSQLTPENYHTITHPTLTMDFLFLSAEYCLAFSTLLVLVTLPSHSVCVFCLVFCIVLHLSLSKC